jgi:hypothetical protein
MPAATRPLSEAALRRVAPHKVRWQHLSADARRRLLEPVVSPEFHGAVEPAALERAFQAGRPATTVVTTPRRVLELRLVHGSIVDANARAIVLGVFRNVDPTGPAAAVDAALGGAIREFTLRRMFGGQAGQVFVMPASRSSLLAELVLFAGLGEFDDFGAESAAFVAENVVRTFARTHVEDFATVLLGAGSGTPVAMAAENQLRGFLEGLRHADPDRVLRRITVCEVDNRKYHALVRAVRRIAASLAGPDIEVVVDEAVLPGESPARPGKSGRRVPAAAVRTREPAYLLVELEKSGRNDLVCRSSLLTAGAKAAVLSGTTTFDRDELQRRAAPLEQATATVRDVSRIGTGLGRLLLAASVREGLQTMLTRPLVVVHEREASRVPWEVLRVGDTFPALGAGMSRRYRSETLTVARWQDDGTRGNPLRLLLVVDPTQDLPGATAEGAVLQDLLQARGVTLDVLRGKVATRERIVSTLAAGHFDVLHFAGHAFFDPKNPASSGLLCAGKDVLRSGDLEALTSLPALVFCNACESARVRKRAQARAAAGHVRSRRQRPMTGVAEGFLSGGVANFLGTHWPVGDESALAFSRTLYERLLLGESLGQAVLAARRQVAELPSLDWADYVHYGSPEFRLVDKP